MSQPIDALGNRMRDIAAALGVIRGPEEAQVAAGALIATAVHLMTRATKSTPLSRDAAAALVGRITREIAETFAAPRS